MIHFPCLPQICMYRRPFLFSSVDISVPDIDQLQSHGVFISYLDSLASPEYFISSYSILSLS